MPHSPVFCALLLALLRLPGGHRAAQRAGGIAGSLTLALPGGRDACMRADVTGNGFLRGEQTC